MCATYVRTFRKNGMGIWVSNGWGPGMPWLFFFPSFFWGIFVPPFFWGGIFLCVFPIFSCWKADFFGGLFGSHFFFLISKDGKLPQVICNYFFWYQWLFSTYRLPDIMGMMIVYMVPEMQSTWSPHVFGFEVWLQLFGQALGHRISHTSYYFSISMYGHLLILSAFCWRNKMLQNWWLLWKRVNLKPWWSLGRRLSQLSRGKKVKTW